MEDVLLTAMEEGAGALFGPAVRLFPLYLLSAVVIAFAVYKATKPEKSFVKWLLPGDVWRHASTQLDIKLFVLARILKTLGLFNQVAVTSTASVLVLLLLRGRPEGGDPAHPLLAGFCVLLAADFAVYCVHRLHHESKWLWPFHSVHHSAEVMTPLTAYRKHPVYDLIASVVQSMFHGFLQGAILAMFFGSISVSTIIGINIFYFVFNLLGSNLRHSHIWLSYGPVLGRILISPAQHQIHHSRAPRHHNKNYGEVLAVWDWMFGTLYVPTKVEVLDFGLADETGRALPQPHGTFREALLEPFRHFAVPLRGTILPVKRK